MIIHGEPQKEAMLSKLTTAGIVLFVSVLTLASAAQARKPCSHDRADARGCRASRL
jgi:hypothetical protein